MRTDAVLLAGGAGFIGSALARHLAEAGREVRVLSRRAAPGLTPGVRYYRGALDDRATVRRALRGCGWLVHLACESVPGTPSSPSREALTSVVPTLRMLEWLPGFPETQLLFVSTGGAIYGDAPSMPAHESQRLAALSYYAAGKASLEAFIHAHCHQHRRGGYVVRPANVYGPGQPLRRGFGAVPTLLEAARRGRPFEVYGGGKTVRDFLYIDDFVELCARLLDRPAPAALTTLNAGSGRGHSVNQLIRLVERVVGRRIARVDRPARRGDVKRIVLDAGAARAHAGWRASTPLAEGLARTWQWYSASRR